MEISWWSAKIGESRVKRNPLTRIVQLGGPSVWFDSYDEARFSRIPSVPLEFYFALQMAKIFAPVSFRKCSCSAATLRFSCLTGANFSSFSLAKQKSKLTLKKIFHNIYNFNLDHCSRVTSLFSRYSRALCRHVVGAFQYNCCIGWQWC